MMSTNYLLEMEGRRSFLKVVRDLIKKKSNFDVILIAFGTRSEEEIEELIKEIRDVKEWMQSSIRA